MTTTPSQDYVKLDLGVKKDTKHYLRCFDAVRKLQKYWNKWITAECWIEIINERYEMPPDLKFTADNLNRAIARDPKFNGIDAIKDKNIHGVFKAQYKANVGKKRLTLTAYYVTNAMSMPQTPGGSAKWYNRLVSSAPQLQQLQNHTRFPPAKRSVPVGPVPTNVSAPVQKRRRQENNNNDDTLEGEPPEQEATTPTHDHEPEEEATPPNPRANPRAQAILDQSWWDTGDAIRYFGARHGEVSAKDAVSERIGRLQAGLSTATGWKRVMDDFDQQDLCSSHEAFNYQLKCRYVSLALRYALDEMPTKTWLDCCQDSVDSINRTDGVNHIRSK